MAKLISYFEGFAAMGSGAFHPTFMQFRTDLREHVEKVILGNWRSDVFGEAEDDKKERGATAIAIIVFLLTWHFQEVTEHQVERYGKALSYACTTVLVDVLKEFCFNSAFVDLSARDCSDRAAQLIDAFNRTGKPSPDVIPLFLVRACHELRFCEGQSLAPFCAYTAGVIDALFEAYV